MAEQALRVCLHAGFWIPLAVCTYLALTPNPPDPISRVSDIVLHTAAFTYLTFSLILAHPPANWFKPAIWMFGYGVVLELLQSLEPERTAEVKDLLVDAGGIILGLLVGCRLGGWTRRVLSLIFGRLFPGDC